MIYIKYTTLNIWFKPRFYTILLQREYSFNVKLIKNQLETNNNFKQ